MDTVALLTREQIDEIRERARDGHYGIDSGLVEGLAAQLLEYMAAYAAQRKVILPRRSQPREAVMARVRAAIAAAGEERMARLTRANASLLEARAAGRTLRALAAEAGVSPQGIQYRERMALQALARES